MTMGQHDLADGRRDDRDGPTHFRTERFFQHNAKWYFMTREGTDEGPFDRLADAEERLREYVQVMSSGWLGEGDGLTLQPIE